jgi:hypothetical protein
VNHADIHQHLTHVPARDPDRQIVIAILIEVTSGQCPSEQIRGTGLAREPTCTSVQELATRCGQSNSLHAVDHIDGAGIHSFLERPDIFAGRTDREIINVVAVEIAGSQVEAEAVIGLVPAPDASARLSPDLSAGGRQADARHAIKDGDGAGVVGSGFIIAGHTNCQIGDAVAVKIAGRERLSESVIRIRRDSGNADIVMIPDLIGLRRQTSCPQAGCGAVDHVHRARRVAIHVVEWHPNREVGIAVAVEVGLVGILDDLSGFRLVRIDFAGRVDSIELIIQ